MQTTSNGKGQINNEDKLVHTDNRLLSVLVYTTGNAPERTL